MIYEQTHTREIKVYGGLWKITPVFGTLMLIASLSSMGLPGLNGFVGEFTILLGAFGSKAIGNPWYAGVAAIGVIMAAIYILYMFQKCSSDRQARSRTTTTSKTSTGARSPRSFPLVVFMFWIGLYPKPFFDILAPAVEKLLSALPL
jgi:NADH-quinone oxidoreductase subunit M